MRKLLSFFALWAMLLAQSPAQVQMDRIAPKGINKDVYVDNFSGANCGAKFASALSFLGSNTANLHFSSGCGTGAWDNFTLPVGDDLTCDQNGTYNVGTITLSGSHAINLKGFGCRLQPSSTSAPFIFDAEGVSQASRIAEIFIYGGFLYANGDTAAGHSAIRFVNCLRCVVRDTVIDGGWDKDIFVDNPSYVYLSFIRSNGAATAGVWAQNTGSSPYFGGPLYLDHVQADSCPCSDSAIHVENISAVEVSDGEGVGVTAGHGLYVKSTNGLGALPPDYANAIHVKGFTFDTIALTGVRFENIGKSSIVGTWNSTGRSTNASCIELQGVTSEITIADSSGFWCGDYSILLGGTATNDKILANSLSGSPNGGVHLAGTPTLNSIAHNNCNSTKLNGAGVTQLFCIFEEATGANNFFEDNDATGTTNGNSYNGTNPIRIEHDGTSVLKSGTFSGAVSSQSFKITDSGQCTMSAGTCSAQNLSHTYAAAPKCFLTWTGTGTLTGILKSPSTTTTTTPASSVGTDTAQVNWECHGS